MGIKKGAAVGDLDEATKFYRWQTEIKTADRLAALQKVKGGYKVRISKDTPTLIEAKIKGKWRHAWDIHAYDSSSLCRSSRSLRSSENFGNWSGRRSCG